MKKRMRRTLAILAVLPAALGLIGLTASSAMAADEVHACTGEMYAASVSSAGHTLSTVVNVCGYYYDGSTATWAPIARFRCLRDGVEFGDGTGGCRWQGTITSWRGGSRVWSTAFAEPGGSTSSYVSDSGRIYGASLAQGANRSIRWCEEDNLINGIVHFVGTTGIDYGTFNMLDHCTDWYNSSNHG